MVAGGPGMTGNITVQAVYIGTPGSSSPAPIATWNHNFLTSGVFASQMGWLSAEYGVGSIATIEPDIVITNPQSTNFTQSYGVVSGTDIQSEIDWQLANSGSSLSAHFPALNPATTIFFVYLSMPWIGAGWNPGGSNNLVCGFNGYNTAQPLSNGKTHHVAVVYDETDSNTTSPYYPCLNNTNTQLAVETRNTAKGNSRPSGAALIQHELAEALTNNWSFPNPPANTDCSQIADPCQFNYDVSYTGGGNTYAIQPMWSNTANGCVTTTRGAQGDLLGFGTSDVVFGHSGDSILPVASPGPAGTFNGNFTLYSLSLDDNYDLNGTPTAFSSWSIHAKNLVGDFDGDGEADVALTGGQGWASIPVAYSNGSELDVTNSTISGQPFASFTTFDAAALPPVVGDFDGDGRADIAVTGGPGWNTTRGLRTGAPAAVARWPSASLRRRGGPASPRPTAGAPAPRRTPSTDSSTRPSRAARVLSSSRVTSTGMGSPTLRSWEAWRRTGHWASIVVATSTGTAGNQRTGRFNVTNVPLSDTDVGSWAASGALAVAGDFNADGVTDIALAGGSGWKSMPVAFGTANLSQFTVVNVQDGTGSNRFSLLTQNSGVQLLAGDWDGIGIDGLAAWNVTNNANTLASAYNIIGTWGDFESTSLGLSLQYYPATASASQAISIYPSPLE